MIPRQIEEVARQHTQMMSAQAGCRATGSARERRQVRRLRIQTGWGLVAIGLRIAESGSR